MIGVPWLCVSLLDPYSLRNHAQLGGGSVAERLMSMLAYGWVERCSDVAGCRMSSYKMIILDHFVYIVIFIINE